MAASAASAASAARRGGFDPAVTLPWAVPLILAAPFVGWPLLVLGGMRGRRAAATVGTLAVTLMLAATVVIAWARFHQAAPYRVAYQWINIPVAVSGDERFTGFGIDLSFRIDHATLAGLAAVTVVLLACLSWHRVAGRGEQGPVRYHANALLLALGAAGVLVSGDLAELLAFWLLAGVGTYLLLGHRWGTEAAGRRSMAALALPFLGDVALLCGVGVIYSRFGALTIDSITPVLHGSIGVGLKSLTAAAVLVFGAVAVRAAVWPFTSWQTATVDAPPASVALVAGVWPVLAGAVLLRALPLLAAAGPQASLIAGYTLGVAAVVGPLLGLLGVDLRRSLLLASSGAVALTLLGMVYPASTTVAFSGLLAVALARAGVLLAAGSAVATLRTVDLRALGGGWERMTWTSAAMLISAAVLSLGGVAAAMLRPQGVAWIAFAAGLLLVCLTVLRAYLAFAHGPLRRRRAFEPARVREVAGAVRWAALVVAAGGVAAVALGFVPAWVDFLRVGGRAVPGMVAEVLWLAPPLAGAVLAAAVLLPRRDLALAAGATLGERLGALWEASGGLYDRFLARPGRQIVHGVEDVGVSAAEAEVGRALARTGGLAGLVERGLPLVPTVLAVAVVLALVFGLLSEGLRR